MLLHIVNKSPFINNSLESCLRAAKKNSGVLFIEDGVYGALDNTAITPQVKKAMKDKKFFVLASDLKARGVSDGVIKGIEVVDYGGFVDLTTQYDVVESWL
ncbi:MAG: sulfurtransferase complex subunit TusB [Gammaproteobacteria bacterium]|nr:sulfurtransferase complex subunit TusB [Gammaproteobacteria bacterium]